MEANSHVNGVTRRHLRTYPQSGLDAFGRWISDTEWFSDLNEPTVDDLTESLTSSLTSAIQRFFPLKSVRTHYTDKPWITPAIKKLVYARQKAFHDGDPRLWRYFRNRVKFEITRNKKSFYSEKVKHRQN